MNHKRSKKFIEKLIAFADIKINGNNPWDLQIHDERLYTRVLQYGTLGIGEAYMDGWWDCHRLDEMVYRAIRAKIAEKITQDPNTLLAIFFTKFSFLLARLFNYQTKERALEVGKRHYDIGNDLYQTMLDKRMNYTCGYWKEANNLDQAQEAKLKLICDKLDLKPGAKVLDIGCGWGGFAKYAAEHYGAQVVGITISHEQLKLGKELCAGLPVELRFQDYRDVNEQFDYIVSLGMFEHVGYKNYRTFMRVAYRCLKDNGLFLLHTIGNNTSMVKSNDWTHKYIFPNGMLPSIKQIGSAVEKYFVMEDWHNFGADYEKTLLAWHDNFSQHWDDLKSNYDERFRRMWTYYLLTSAGAFRARDMQLWQIVLSKRGLIGGYSSIR